MQHRTIEKPPNMPTRNVAHSAHSTPDTVMIVEIGARVRIELVRCSTCCGGHWCAECGGSGWLERERKSEYRARRTFVSSDVNWNQTFVPAGELPTPF
jgi:hypothetical protein